MVFYRLNIKKILLKFNQERSRILQLKRQHLWNQPNLRELIISAFPGILLLHNKSLRHCDT